MGSIARANNVLVADIERLNAGNKACASFPVDNTWNLCFILGPVLPLLSRQSLLHSCANVPVHI